MDWSYTIITIRLMKFLSIKDISGTINDGDIRSGCKWVQRTNSDLNIVKKHWGNDKVTYNVTLKTGNVSGAGTDSNIWIKIYGSLQTVTLHDGKAINSLVSGNAFERNDTDRFSWYGLDPGNIYQVGVWFDDAYAGSDWYLDYLDVSTPRGNWRVQFYRWFENSYSEVKMDSAWQ